MKTFILLCAVLLSEIVSEENDDEYDNKRSRVTSGIRDLYDLAQNSRDYAIRMNDDFGEIIKDADSSYSLRKYEYIREKYLAEKSKFQDKTGYADCLKYIKSVLTNNDRRFYQLIDTQHAVIKLWAIALEDFDKCNTENNNFSNWTQSANDCDLLRKENNLTTANNCINNVNEGIESYKSYVEELFYNATELLKTRKTEAQQQLLELLQGELDPKLNDDESLDAGLRQFCSKKSEESQS